MGLQPDEQAGRRYDPVTAADKELERAMRALIEQPPPPNDHIWGEEEAQSHGTSGLTWCLPQSTGRAGSVSGNPDMGRADRVEPMRAAWRPGASRPSPMIGERFAAGSGGRLHRVRMAQARLRVRGDHRYVRTPSSSPPSRGPAQRPSAPGLKAIAARAN